MMKVSNIEKFEDYIKQSKKIVTCPYCFKKSNLYEYDHTCPECGRIYTNELME